MLKLEDFETVKLDNPERLHGGGDTEGGSHTYGDGTIAVWDSDSNDGGCWCYEGLEYYYGHGAIAEQ